ncbi:MAG: hypothetical protein WCT12_28790 [Verrucomicrobiota bacterium]|jgi:hypothetical protein
MFNVGSYGIDARFLDAVNGKCRGGIPNTLFQCVSNGILFRWGDAVHEQSYPQRASTMRVIVFQIAPTANTNKLRQAVSEATREAQA